jgi:molybdenum-dependent DNA-binding transcriptional regulator ModE
MDKEKLEKIEQEILQEYFEREKRITEAVEKRKKDINELAQRISKNPELLEHHLVMWLWLIEENGQLIKRSIALKNEARTMLLRMKDTSEEKLVETVKKMLPDLKKKLDEIDKKMEENSINIEFYNRVFQQLENYQN